MGTVWEEYGERIGRMWEKYGKIIATARLIDFLNLDLDTRELEKPNF